MFLTIRLLGVMLWIWLILLFQLCILLYVIWYFYSESIIGFIHRLRTPQKVVKLIIHYKTGYFKTYWRLIPDENLFKIDKKLYIYDPKVVTKDHDFWVTHRKDIPMILIVRNLFTKTIHNKEYFQVGDTEEYEYNKMFEIKERFSQYPEIHYNYNNPTPINFDGVSKTIQFSSSSLNEFHETDLLGKLLKLKYESMMLMFMLILLFANLGITIFLLCKVMGWVK